MTAVPIYQESGKDLVMGDDFIHLNGRCMCGAVEVSTAAPFVGALYCHCKRCQRRSGTTRSMTALCPPGAFSVTAGEVKVRVWDPGRRLDKGVLRRLRQPHAHHQARRPDAGSGPPRMPRPRPRDSPAGPPVRHVRLHTRAAARRRVTPLPRATGSQRPALTGRCRSSRKHHSAGQRKRIAAFVDCGERYSGAGGGRFVAFGL